MAKETFYRQCTLSRGNSRTVGYIEERGARVGVSVELYDDDGAHWHVMSVGDKRLAKAELQFMRDANKHASLDG